MGNFPLLLCFIIYFIITLLGLFVGLVKDVISLFVFIVSNVMTILKFIFVVDGDVNNDHNIYNNADTNSDDKSDVDGKDYYQLLNKLRLVPSLS